MRATFRSICRFREALSQIGDAVSASAEYSRLSASREDAGLIDASCADSRAIHIHL
jgi:hypothetical protein